jgi:hypothetical protein
MNFFKRPQNPELLELRAKVAQLEQALAAAPKATTPDNPIEFICKDKFGNNYYSFKSEEQLTTWRAEGIFKIINNSSLSISDADLILHEQLQNELFSKLSNARPDEKTELQRQFFHNSARLQERIRNCGEYEFLLALSRLVMVCENEPLEYEKSAGWEQAKTQRLKADPNLLGFFLPKAATLNEGLKAYQKSEQMGLLIQLVSLAQTSQQPIQTVDI